eukprot:880431_1
MDQAIKVSSLAPLAEEWYHYHPLNALLRQHDGDSLPSILSSNTPRHLSAIAESEWFDITAQIMSSVLLFILIFGMSATVEVEHLRSQLHNKFAILTGVATQFLVMPALGYLSVILLKDHGLT